MHFILLFIKMQGFKISVVQAASLVVSIPESFRMLPMSFDFNG